MLRGHSCLCGGRGPAHCCRGVPLGPQPTPQGTPEVPTVANARLSRDQRLSPDCAGTSLQRLDQVPAAPGQVPSLSARQFPQLTPKGYGLGHLQEPSCSCSGQFYKGASLRPTVPSWCWLCKALPSPGAESWGATAALPSSVQPQECSVATHPPNWYPESPVPSGASCSAHSRGTS